MNNKVFNQFKKKLVELAHLKTTLALLHWDLETQMPPKGMERRAQTTAYLSELLHRKFLSKPFERLLKSAKDALDRGELDEKQAIVVREVWREFEIETKLPTKFIKKFSELTSKAHQVWADARSKSSFKLFKPILSKIVDLSREQAQFLGYKNSPYDALLDLYEPGMTSDEVSKTLYDLRSFLVPFIKRIKGSTIKPNSDILSGDFSPEAQQVFNRLVIKQLGFDFEAGRMDVSTHPFATSLHPYDARITTRYDKNNLFQSLFGTIHETGHALYDQGLPYENFGTPLAETISLGIHESQSRMWENLVGRSEPFWKFFYPKLKAAFPQPFINIEFSEFYRAINSVAPSLIRVEADEVTYNLHIVIRFEIEKALIEGSVEVADLPVLWNSKVKEYLGLDVPDEAAGVLQDVHWAWGSFGYFPTYTLGNLYSAQFYNKAKQDILNLEELIERGQFQPLREWLKSNIHRHGKFYSASDLVKKVTGEGLTSKYFIDYLTKKYSEIYKL